MMMNPVSIFLLIIASFNAHTQSKIIEEVFRLLPGDKIDGLTISTRDSMLEGKTYYPASNSDDEVVAYNYGISINVEDYMFVSMAYETDQRASAMIEIRGFKTTAGKRLVIVSKTAGVWQVAYSQNELSAFIYDNKKLITYDKKLFPATDISLFMKPGIPDSVKKIIVDNSNTCFDFSKKKVMLTLGSNYLMANPTTRKWLKGDRIYFDWIKDRFVVRK